MGLAARQTIVMEIAKLSVEYLFSTVGLSSHLNTHIYIYISISDRVRQHKHKILLFFVVFSFLLCVGRKFAHSTGV